MNRLHACLTRMRPRSFAGQTLAATVLALFVAQALTMAFFGLFVLQPQAERVAGIVAQTIAAASDAAELSEPAARAAIVARLDASEYIDVWPGNAAPANDGPRPRLLERIFMQALVDAMADRTEQLYWRTDQGRRLWLQVRIGPELYWISARSPEAIQPFAAVLASTAATFLIGLVLAVALHRRMVRPLARLTEAAESMGAATPAPQVEERGPRELRALARGFNQLGARLAAADRERAIMLAGVSHDVRTPLAKLRLAVEMLAREEESLGRAAHVHVQEIDRILSKFLTFARGFDAEPIADFDLDALIAEIVAAQAVEGAEFAIVGRAGTVRGRPDALRRALSNLTENAVLYGIPPYAVEAQAGADHVAVLVRDGGGGPSAALEKLRAPFVRGDPSAGAGAGLGLAIVESVAALHNGDLAFVTPADGGFAVRLRVRASKPMNTLT